MDIIRDKYLIMLVGPSAIGKSTIMNSVARLDSRFYRVKSFTTRSPRPNDETGQYFYLTYDQLTELSSAGDVVSQVTSPATGQAYGTLKSSYSGVYNLLDTLANSVDTYRQLPFKQTTVLSLTTSADRWREWFLQRYPRPSQEARSRLEEARLSIHWSLSQSHHHQWLINDAAIAKTSHRLIGMIINQAAGDDGAVHARAILDIIERGDIWPKK